MTSGVPATTTASHRRDAEPWTDPRADPPASDTP